MSWEKLVFSIRPEEFGIELAGAALFCFSRRIILQGETFFQSHLSIQSGQVQFVDIPYTG